MATSADDIEFVLSEVARIAGWTQRDGAKPSFPEWCATLPHPSGSGEMRCGIAAYERLQNRAAFALSNCGHAGRIDPRAVFQELRSIVVQRFIREGREVNIREADRAVSAAIKAVAKNRTDLTHFVPCHLGHATTPEEFSIGPVRFGQRSGVLVLLSHKIGYG